MWFVYWVATILVVTSFIDLIFQNKLNKVIESYDEWSKAYDKESKVYKDAYYSLLSEYNKAISVLDTYKKTSGNIHINDDIRSALKFAMIYSHPDKGNCKDADEFIKFKKLYDKYK